MLNEEAGICDTVQRIRAALTQVCRTWELIIVDDGSADASAAIVEACAKEDARIRLIRLPGRQGYGCALRAGFAAARYDLISFTDADWPCDVRVISEILPLFDHVDLVAGYRVHRWEGLRRWCYSTSYNMLVRWLFGLRLRDVNFSLKVWKRRVTEAVWLSSRGIFIDVELLASAHAAGFRIAQYPVEYLARRHGRSTLSSLSVIRRILSELARHWWRTRGPNPSSRATPPDVLDHEPSQRDVDRGADVGRQIIARYATAGWLHRAYLRGRWRTCPFEALESRLPRAGTLVDYGCGAGLFAHLLRLQGPTRTVIGYDPDARKIRLANASLIEEAGLLFTTTPPWSSADHRYKGIALIDVLPYLRFQDGLQVLHDCHRSLAPGGVLLVKDIAERPRLKFILTYLQEFFAVRVFKWTWAQEGRFTFWKRAQFERVLRDLGCSFERIDLSRGFLHPHVLWLAVKPAAWSPGTTRH